MEMAANHEKTTVSVEEITEAGALLERLAFRYRRNEILPYRLYLLQN